MDYIPVKPEPGIKPDPEASSEFICPKDQIINMLVGKLHEAKTETDQLKQMLRERELQYQERIQELTSKNEQLVKTIQTSVQQRQGISVSTQTDTSTCLICQEYKKRLKESEEKTKEHTQLIRDLTIRNRDLRNKNQRLIEQDQDASLTKKCLIHSMPAIDKLCLKLSTLEMLLHEDKTVEDIQKKMESIE